MLDSKMCPVHGLFLPPLSHIPSLLNHPLVHLQDICTQPQVFPVFTFQFFPFFEAFSNYPIQGSPYILSSTWASSLSESVRLGVLAFHFQPNQDYTQSVCLDRCALRHTLRLLRNKSQILALLGQGSPSPISIYSSLGHVNTFINTLIYLFIE